MVTSRVVERTQDGYLGGVFFLLKRQNDECNVRRFLFGTSHDLPVFRVRVFTHDYEF